MDNSLLAVRDINHKYIVVERKVDIMRLDKYLKVSRLIKRRTVANEACDAGRVLVNDKPAKASVQVKTGDTVEIRFGTRNVRVEVLEVKDTVKKDEVEMSAPSDEASEEVSTEEDAEETAAEEAEAGEPEEEKSEE